MTKHLNRYTGNTTEAKITWFAGHAKCQRHDNFVMEWSHKKENILTRAYLTLTGGH